MIIVLFLVFTILILTNSELSLQYAMQGLNLWFNKMVPALLPFMILSGIMVRMNLTERVALLLYPVLSPIWKVGKNVIYCMMMGFLCGFPMGARTTAELYRAGGITKREAQYLLSFCNNIGPVYFCSFALPLIHRRHTLIFLFGMYGIPLIYSLVLRYCIYRDIDPKNESGVMHPSYPKPKLPEALEESVKSSLTSMLILGGYMIIFNLFLILPHKMIGKAPTIFAPILEITGGLMMLDGRLPIYNLLCLSFGGLCCIAQTYSCMHDTEISITGYIIHKCILTVICALFYLLLLLSAPELLD